jgi:hypothetical protein
VDRDARLEEARARAEHPALAQLIFRPGTILGETVASPITALFERAVITGVVGSEAPFVLIWDDEVAACILKGIRERRAGVYNLAGDGALGLREIARRLGRPYLPLPPRLLAGALRPEDRVVDLLYRPPGFVVGALLAALGAAAALAWWLPSPRRDAWMGRPLPIEEGGL